MPTKSTFSPGAMTSRRPLLAAANSSAGLGRADDVAARLFVRLKPDQSPLARFLEQVGKRPVAVVGLVEARIAALQRLLDHRAPDLLVRAALGDQCLQRAEEDIESFLLLVLLVLAG